MNTFSVKNPDEIVFTMTATYSLSEWKRIVKDMDQPSTWPMSDFKIRVEEMVSQATKIYYSVPTRKDKK